MSSRLTASTSSLRVVASPLAAMLVWLLMLWQPPPDALRAHDFRLDARVTLAARHNVLRIPQAALFRSDDQWRAFRIENGRARSIEVTVGIGDGNDREVLQGLALGDRVVLYPRSDLLDGARVR